MKIFNKLQYATEMSFLSLLFCQAQGLAESGSDAETIQRPNVIIIYTDDQEFEQIGCYGGNVYTPYQDKLAKDGVRFTRGYVSSSICQPSRYSCLTGQYPSRCKHPEYKEAYPNGSQTYVGFNTHLYEKTYTLAAIMRRNGYKTGMVGKWHLGPWYFPEELRRPNESYTKDPWIKTDDQFDPKNPAVIRKLQEIQQVWSDDIKRFGFGSAERIYFSVSQSFRNHALNGHNLEWTAEGALSFIDRNKDREFFLYFAPTLMHDPHPQKSLLGGDPKLTPAGYLDKIPEGMPSREAICQEVEDKGYGPETAYCTWLDEGIGAVMNKLKKEGLYENTIIIFCSDNQLEDKVSLYEGGIRVPMIISWPQGIASGRVCNEIVQNMDFLPTILSACGIEMPKEMRPDGKDLMPLLRGEKTALHKELFFEIGWTRAICTERYKYVALRYPGEIQQKRDDGEHFYHFTPLEFYQIGIMLRHPDYFDGDQLYDLEVDPDETNNLAGNLEYAEILQDMKGRLESYLESFPSHPFGEFNRQ
jgi:arylsulfatase A-like enzyme